MKSNERLGIIGLGNVGNMLLNKFLELKLIDENNIFVANRSKEKLYNLTKKYCNLNICENNRELAMKCNNILFCVEPLNIPSVMEEIRHVINSQTYLMFSTTMVAHKDLYKLHEGKITIFMPTLISALNKGVTLAFHNKHVDTQDRKLFDKLIGPISEINILKEDDIKLSQNLTASFPGFLAEIMLEFVKSASKYSQKVSDDQLEHMLLLSLEGAGRLLLDKNMSFQETIDRVSTKGGITYEGIRVYKKMLPEVFDAAMEATINKYDAITEEACRLIDKKNNG